LNGESSHTLTNEATMIDLQNETPLGLAEAAAKLPPFRRGRPVTASCVLPWILSGVKLASGEVVKLEATRIGRRWITSAEALQRFADRQTPTLDRAPPATPPPPATRRRSSERAEKALAKLGI
jgi:hypothetical protein